MSVTGGVPGGGVPAGGTAGVSADGDEPGAVAQTSGRLATPVDREPDAGDAGIGMTSVLVMLIVLGCLVVGIFWALPDWFGSQVIEVTIRN